MKKFLSVFLSFFILVPSLLVPETGYAAVAVPITAPSALLYDQTNGRMIYSKTPHLRRAPASTTKILTAIVVMDNLDLNAIVTIPRAVNKVEPSKVYLKPGERYRVRELLQAMLISSANDAAETLAIAVGGSRAGFAKLLNQKVRAIGGQNSNFVTPSGLPAPGMYSTAHDMALIVQETRNYPFVMQTLSVRTMMIKSTGGRKIFLRNHNKMLFRGHREVVGKTGYTRAARYCFVGQINRYNRSVVISMLGSQRLWRDVMMLVQYQFGLSIASAAKKGKVYSKKSDIVKIQKALKKAGFFRARATGVYGPITINAVKRFQKSRGLKADGLVGPTTWAKLSAFF